MLSNMYVDCVKLENFMKKCWCLWKISRENRLGKNLMKIFSWLINCIIIFRFMGHPHMRIVWIPAYRVTCAESCREYYSETECFFWRKQFRNLIFICKGWYLRTAWYFSASYYIRTISYKRTPISHTIRHLSAYRSEDIIGFKVIQNAIWRVTRPCAICSIRSENVVERLRYAEAPPPCEL